MHIQLTDHAIERGRQRLGEAWAIETSGHVPFEDWLLARVAPAIRAHGGPADERVVIMQAGDVLVYGRLEGKTVIVVTIARASTALAHRTRNMRGKSRRAKGRPEREPSIEEQMREWEVA